MIGKKSLSLFVSGLLIFSSVPFSAYAKDFEETVNTTNSSILEGEPSGVDNHNKAVNETEPKELEQDNNGDLPAPLNVNVSIASSENILENIEAEESDIDWGVMFVGGLACVTGAMLTATGVGGAAGVALICIGAATCAVGSVAMSNEVANNNANPGQQTFAEVFSSDGIGGVGARLHDVAFQDTGTTKENTLNDPVWEKVMNGEDLSQEEMSHVEEMVQTFVEYDFFANDYQCVYLNAAWKFYNSGDRSNVKAQAAVYAMEHSDWNSKEADEYSIVNQATKGVTESQLYNAFKSSGYTGSVADLLTNSAKKFIKDANGKYYGWDHNAVFEAAYAAGWKAGTKGWKALMGNSLAVSTSNTITKGVTAIGTGAEKVLLRVGASTNNVLASRAAIATGTATSKVLSGGARIFISKPAQAADAISGPVAVATACIDVTVNYIAANDSQLRSDAIRARREAREQRQNGMP